MKMRSREMRMFAALAALLASAALAAAPATGPLTTPTTAPTSQPADTPQVGQAAPDFTLSTLDDKPVSLAAALKEGPAVVVVLRGWPGYQCPICTKQVGDLIVRNAEFRAEQARVILVYPGPAEDLKAHAAEFAIDESLPSNFSFVLDPGYAFTNAWHLRWDAAGETAYPSSFVIDKSGIVRYAKVSRSHGGRASPAEIVNAVKAWR